MKYKRRPFKRPPTPGHALISKRNALIFQSLHGSDGNSTCRHNNSSPFANYPTSTTRHRKTPPIIFIDKDSASNSPFQSAVPRAPQKSKGLLSAASNSKLGLLRDTDKENIDPQACKAKQQHPSPVAPRRGLAAKRALSCDDNTVKSSTKIKKSRQPLTDITVTVVASDTDCGVTSSTTETTPHPTNA